MRDTVNDIVVLSELLAKASGRSVTTISRLATGSGMTVQRLKSGRRITTDRACRALQWLDENWDGRAKWPVDIPRSSTSSKSAA